MKREHAQRLREGRRRAEMTQEQAATALNVAVSTYREWERPGGAEPATTSKLVEIAELYDLSLDWWLRNEKHDDPLAEISRNAPRPIREALYLLISAIADNTTAKSQKPVKTVDKNRNK